MISKIEIIKQLNAELEEAKFRLLAKLFL